jgi:preprotein translocase subunit SecF
VHPWQNNSCIRGNIIRAIRGNPLALKYFIDLTMKIFCLNSHLFIILNSIKLIMKLKLLVLLLLSYYGSFAQENLFNSSNNPELRNLNALEQRIQNQDNQLRLFDQQLQKNAAQILEENAALRAEIKANLDVQAQNERALNITLNEFSEKFEAQNKTMQDVQATLDSQWSQQLALFGIIFIVLIITVVVTVKISTKKVLEKRKLSWDDFNEYVISGRHKGNA